MTLHLHAAEAQPATHWRDAHFPDLEFKNHPRAQLRCHVCGRRRWARSLVVRSEYDRTVMSCVEGCKPAPKAGR